MPSGLHIYLDYLRLCGSPGAAASALKLHPDVLGDESPLFEKGFRLWINYKIRILLPFGNMEEPGQLRNPKIAGNLQGNCRVANLPLND